MTGKPSDLLVIAGGVLSDPNKVFISGEDWDTFWYTVNSDLRHVKLSELHELIKVTEGGGIATNGPVNIRTGAPSLSTGPVNQCTPNGPVKPRSGAPALSTGPLSSFNEAPSTWVEAADDSPESPLASPFATDQRRISTGTTATTATSDTVSVRVEN